MDVGFLFPEKAVFTERDEAGMKRRIRKVMYMIFYLQGKGLHLSQRFLSDEHLFRTIQMQQSAIVSDAR